MNNYGYSILPANCFRIFLDVRTRNSINIWLPESVSINDKGVFHTCGGENGLEFKSTRTKGASSYKKIQNKIEFRSSIEKNEFGFSLRIVFKNLTNKIL